MNEKNYASDKEITKEEVRGMRNNNCGETGSSKKGREICMVQFYKLSEESVFVYKKDMKGLKPIDI